ncbi:MAG: hypothetical protein JJ714_09960 [Acidithiobacillus sp.]|nr:hypothetical protein [Acidithiobacillus sp.]
MRILRLSFPLCLALFLYPILGMASLRFLLPPVSSPTVMYAAFQPLTAELEKTLGESIELSFSADLHQFYLKAAEKRAQCMRPPPLALW